MTPRRLPSRHHSRSSSSSWGESMALRSLPALALLDPDQHALAVDIVDLEVRDLGDAQARAIGDAERRLVLDARRGLEQPGGLLDAQHLAQLAGCGRATSPRARSRRLSVTVRKKRSAETVLLIVPALAPHSC